MTSQYFQKVIILFLITSLIWTFDATAFTAMKEMNSPQNTIDSLLEKHKRKKEKKEYNLPSQL